MDFPNDLYQWMQANANIGTDQIYPEVIDSALTGVGITYTLETTHNEYASGGFSNMCDSEIILGVWGKDRGDVGTVAKSLHDELHSLSGALVSGGTHVSDAKILDQASDFEHETEFYLFTFLVKFNYRYA